MLKFLLLVVLFIVFKKDLLEGIDNVESEDSGNSSSGTEPLRSERASSSNERAVLQNVIEKDEKIFTYLIGGGIGFAIGITCGIIYHVIHTEDNPSS